MNDSEEDKVEQIEEVQENKKVRPKPIPNLDILDVGGLFNYIRNPTRMFFLNLLAGMARGLGFAIGMTILAALLIFLLRRIVNIPYLGKFIAQLLEVVEVQRSLYR